MTGETKAKTDSWIAEAGAKFAYAYDPGKKLMRELGVSGIPAAFLIDPSGTIVWSGHPSNLQANVIESHLGGALRLPVWEWPKSTAGVKKSLAKGDFAKAHEEATSLAAKGEPDAEAIATAISGLIAGKIKAVESALAAGDMLGATTKAEALVKGLKGRDADVERVEKILDQIGEDKSAKEIIKGQKLLAKLKSNPPQGKRDIEKLIPTLAKVAKKYEGTIVERDANAWRAELVRTMGGG